MLRTYLFIVFAAFILIIAENANAADCFCQDTVNVSGDSVTRVSGCKFLSYWVNEGMTINGNVYYASSVIDSSHLIVSGFFLGSQNGVILNFIALMPPPTVICHSDTFECASNSIYSSFQWYYYNGNPIGGATDSFFVAPIKGPYIIEVSDLNGCTATDTVTCFLTGIKTIEKEKPFSIYPNPSFGIITISLAENIKGEINIFNLMGEKVCSQSFNGRKQEINFRLSEGVYFVRVRDRDREWAEKALVE